MKRCFFVVLLALTIPTRALSSVASTSKIYVTAATCAVDSKGNRVDIVGSPSVTLYDVSLMGDPAYKGISPQVTVTRKAGAEIRFYFDANPGVYDAFVRFPSSLHGGIGDNGPLIVISGQDRHLVVGACNSITDWHASSAIAGILPLSDISVSVLTFERPIDCGDNIRIWDQQRGQPMFKFTTWHAVIDDGAYYANFHGYGKQDQTVALLFSGGLYSEGAILVAKTPNTAADKPAFIRKDVTPAMIEAALAARQASLCGRVLTALGVIRASGRPSTRAPSTRCARSGARLRMTQYFCLAER